MSGSLDGTRIASEEQGEFVMNQILTADEFVRETRHRVKNSLQLVVGMLSLQARQSQDEALVRGLREAMTRVATVAHLHEHLQYLGARCVDVADYLKDICIDLNNGVSQNSHDIRLEAEHIEMDGPRALVVGLIVNELVTNALKHAYPDDSGPITVRFERTNSGLMLTIFDQGVGNSGVNEGLGLAFVRMLARKLQGELTNYDCKPGTGVRLKFQKS